MEQRDSLKGELQNLTRLQSEQINILKDMSGKQSEQVVLEQSKQVQQQANFNTPAMYQHSAPSQANPFGNNYGSSQGYSYGYQSPFGNPYGGSGAPLNAGGKFGFVDVLSPGSKVSTTGRTLLAMEEGSKIAKAGVTLGGAGLAYGASSLAGAIAPGIAGIGLGMAGGAIVGLGVDASVDEIKKNNALKKYIYKNSSQFIDPFETNNERGVAGFSREETNQAADFVRTMNDELFVSDDDMMLMLQKFTEGGLLKETKDLDTFKEKMVSLSKTVKEGALMLNETYDSIADLMAEMRAAGIDEKSFKDLLGSGSVLGALMGKDGSELLRNFIDWVKNFNAGTGNSNEKTYERLEDTGIYMSQWYDKLKTTDKKDLSFTDQQNLNMIENLGGADEASKYTLGLMEKMVEKEQFKAPGLYFYDYDEASKEFKFNEKNFDKFKQGDMSLQELTNDATAKLNTLRENGHGNAVTLWNNQYSSYFKDSLEDGDLADFVGSVLNTYTKDPQMQANGYDYRGILSLFGVEDSANQNLLTGFLDFKGANPDLAKTVKFQNLWQQQTATQLAETPSLTERFKSGWESTKDSFTQGAVNLDNTLGEIMQNIQDWFSGYKPMPKFDKTFTSESNLKNYTLDEVTENIKQTNDMFASSFNSLKTMQEKGYSIDQNLYNFMQKKFDVSDKTVTYDREVITSWDKVSKDLQESKDLITEIASKNDLSETIVAALFKYNQQKPQDQKLDIATVDSDFNKKLGDNLFSYGGNNQLALAATLGGTTAVDNALNKLGYNVDNLRSVGAQEALVDINLDGLGLNEDLVAQIREILTQNLKDTKTTTSTTGEIYVPQSKEDMAKQELTQQSNVTAEDLNKVIDYKTANKPNSIMKGMGETIMQAAEETGLDPMYLLTHAGLETGWGTSGIVNGKYNWFGIGAYNSSPGESAYKFSDKSAGFVEGAKWIKKNYTDKGQNTVEGMIGVPGHNYAVYDDGSPNLEWKENISKDMIYNLNLVNKGYGTETTITTAGDDQTGSFTSKEKVTKNQDGSIATPEEIQKSKEQEWAEQGFATQSTASYKALDSFLTQTNVVDKLKTETPQERTARIGDKITQYEKDGTFKGGADPFNGGLDFDKMEAQKLVKNLLDMINEGLESGAYGSVDDVVEGNTKVQKNISKIKKYFNDDGAANEFIDEILNEQKVVDSGTLKDGMSQYEILQTFGQQFLGIDRTGLMEDSTKYNARLETETKSFYESNLAMLKGFLGGDQESAEYQAWAGKTASEQEALLDTLKKLEYALGKDGEESEVSKVMEGKTNDDIHTEEDNYKKSFIHEDKDGRLYYDESKEAEKEISWGQYNDWVKQGEKKLSYGAISKLIDSNDLATTDEEGKTLSLEALIQTTKENMNKVSEEQYKLISQDASSLVKDLMTNKEQYVGMSTSEKQDLASGNQNTVDQAKNAYEQFLGQIGDMIKYGDAEGLRNLRETEKENGRTFDDGQFDQFIELAEKIKSMDASEFMKIINGLDEIMNRSSDMAKAVALFTGTDGTSETGLGAGFSEKFTEELIGSVKSVFEGTDFGDSVSSGKYNIDSILEIIQNGGVDGSGEVILSPDSLDKMAQVMSNALDTTFEERLSTTGGIEEFQNSELVSMFKDGIVVKVGDTEQTLDEAMQRLSEIVSQGTEATADALAEKDTIIEQVQVAFQEQINQVGTVAADAQSELDEVSGKTTDTVKSFVGIIEEYDEAMQSAVSTLGGSIKTLNTKVKDVKNDVDQLKWYNKLGNGLFNGFGSKSSGDAVNPPT